MPRKASATVELRESPPLRSCVAGGPDCGSSLFTVHEGEGEIFVKCLVCGTGRIIATALVPVRVKRIEQAPATRDETVRAVFDMVREIAKKSPRGYARSEDIQANCPALSTAEVDGVLNALLRNSTVYAKGGVGTFAPLT